MMKTYKILLVEDLELAQIIAKYTLTTLKCDVDVASTGAEAIQKVHDNHYDFVLMDLGLPDMDGFITTQKIRETNKVTPIIALTAHVDTQYKAQALASGMNGFLSKPLDEKAVRELLKM